MSGCKHNVPCGCADKPLTTPNPCGDGIDCPDATECSETFAAPCIVWTGDDVDCGAVNLATAGDTMEDILAKVCLRFDSIMGTSGFFNILQPTEDGNVDDVIIFGNADEVNLTADQPLFADRIGCSDDITITLDSADGILFSAGGTVITMAGDNSIIISEFEHPVGLPVGVYTATLTWEACGITKVQNITFNLA